MPRPTSRDPQMPFPPASSLVCTLRSPGAPGPEMLRPLLLPLLCAGCLAQSPRYKLEVQESVTLQEGQCAFVPCRIRYPTLYTRTSSVFGSWFRAGANVKYDPPVATGDPDQAVQEETKGRFQLLGDPNSNNCSLDIRDARPGDSGSYFFRIYGIFEKYSFLSNQLSVNVQALTQTPDILIPGTPESGRPMNISCAAPWACRRGTPPIFSWTGATLASALGSETPHGPVLTLTPGPQHHGANITCRVTFPGADNVTTERTVQLAVSYAPQNLTISVLQGNGTGPQALGNGSSLRLQEGESLRLACLADSNPPALPHWARGSLLLQPARSSVPGLLELTRAQVEDEGQYVCTAGNALGAQKASVSLLVTGKSAPGTQQVLLLAFGLAAVKILLLILCVTLLSVRSRRRKAARPAADRECAYTVTVPPSGQ